jgi:hypothetical protein
MRALCCSTLVVLLGATVAAVAQDPRRQDALLERARKGTKCEEVLNNGRYCKYEFGRVLSVGIKDVGGSDTVVGFHNSNIKNELYAVMYFGCVAVVPGESHPRNYGLDYGIHISPKTGLVYRTSAECRASL